MPTVFHNRRYRHVKHLVHEKSSKALVRAGGANFLKKKAKAKIQVNLKF